MLGILQEHAEPGLIFQRVIPIDSRAPSIQDQAKAFTYFVPVKNADKVAGVMAKLGESDKIIIQSYSKKEGRDLDKDIRPLLLEIKSGNFDIDSKMMDLIDEVSPCRMPGILVKTSLSAGSGVRPSELMDLFSAHGLEVERPIKIAADLQESLLMV